MIDRITDVMRQAGDVREPEIHLANVVLLGELKDFFGCHDVFTRFVTIRQQNALAAGARAFLRVSNQLA